MTQPEQTEQPQHQPGTTSRRGVIIGAGVVGGGIVVTACGGGKESPPSSSAAASSQAPSAPSVKTADVPVGGGVVVKKAEAVVTQPQSGQFKAFTAVCSHKSCTVSAVVDNVIECPCHGSRFSAVDGSVIKGPAEKPLAAMTVTVAGDSLTVG